MCVFVSLFVCVRVRMCRRGHMGCQSSSQFPFCSPLPQSFRNVFGFNFAERRRSQDKSTMISEIGGGCAGHYTLTTSLGMLGPLVGPTEPRNHIAYQRCPI